MPVSNLTAFSAGAFTLGGWVTDFVATDDGSPTAAFQINRGNAAGESNFDFNWADNTSSWLTFTPTGNEPAQTISVNPSSSGTDTVSLSLSFSNTNGITEGGQLYFASGNGTHLLDATTPSGMLLLGGSSGESGSALQTQLQSLQIFDTQKINTFSIKFTLTDIGTNAGTTSWSENFGTACYTPGTRVATPGGETAVEDLQIGDLVLTASGAPKPIKWIGRRGYGAEMAAACRTLRPVLIRNGALATNVPHRDLRVSPMHALFIDEVFVPAAALVNGVSILRCDAGGEIHYLHIELQDHAVIFAEGAPAESYVDDHSRAMFDNASEYYDLYGIAAANRCFCAPRLEEGYQLEVIRHRLAARAGAAAAAGALGELAGHVERLENGLLEGWVMDRVTPAAPVELEMLLDGEIVATMLANRYRVDLDRAGLAAGRCGFTVAVPAAAASLAQIEVRRRADGSRVPMRQPALAGA